MVLKILKNVELLNVYLIHIHTTLCLQNLHKNLEQKLAEFHEREDCILYASCFDANAGLFEVRRRALHSTASPVVIIKVSHPSHTRFCWAQTTRCCPTS